MQDNEAQGERQPAFTEQLPTGVAGLDQVLMGGLPRRHLYLLEGESGTGKTTIGMQFLLEGVRRGEKTLLITLAETAADLEETARSHGWALEGLDIFELPPLKQARLEDQQTVFPTAEVELSEASKQIHAALNEMRPQRVVIDSLTQLRLLAAGPVRFRYQMLALSDALMDLEATAIFVDRLAPNGSDSVLDSLVHGIIRLQQITRDYGSVWRRMTVSKLRGARYQGGWHDFRIETGGLQVYPRLRMGSERVRQNWDRLSSGLGGLDTLLGGGLEMGTACLISGASGTGKSSVATLFVHAALEQNIPSAMLLFDERPETLYKRSRDINLPLRAFADQGLLTVQQIATGAISAGEFSDRVSSLVTDSGVRVLVIDSLTGYMRAIPEENLLLNQLHDLLNYLSRKHVLSILVVTHHGLFGEQMQKSLDMSYLSDTVMLLRHFEAKGALHHAISVVKKRHGEHEKTIRELSLLAGGISIGEPLQAFRGVLTGNPDFMASPEALLDPHGEKNKGQ